MPDPPVDMPVKTYRVIGPHSVRGNDPGSEFRDAFHPEHEEHLIQGGHIAVVPAASAPAKNAPREDWDAHATKLGINPTDFPSKDALIAEVERVTGGGN